MTLAFPEPEGTPLNGAETLARFLFSRRCYSIERRALRPEAFDPPPDLKLSVTRHRSLGEAELWRRGQEVGVLRAKALFGRADLTAAGVQESGPEMKAVAAWEEHNPEHAHIVGWTSNPAYQKSVKQVLAAVATFLPAPAEPSTKAS